MNQRYGKWKWVNNENKCEFIISITDKDISVSGVEREENENLRFQGFEDVRELLSLIVIYLLQIIWRIIWFILMIKEKLH